MSSIKEKVLAEFLEVDVDEVSEMSYDSDIIEYESEEYLVVTDSEADERFDEYMDSLIDEIVLDQMPENLRSYFDDEKYKRDVKLSDGRGHILSSYDGYENDLKYKGTWYFIYRVN